MPTETVYGSARLPSRAICRRLVAAKQRSSRQGHRRCSSTARPGRAPGRRHGRCRAPRRALLAGRPDPRPAAPAGHRAARAADRRPAHARRPAARPRRAARAGPSPRAARGQLGQRVRRAGRDDRRELVEHAVGDAVDARSSTTARSGAACRRPWSIARDRGRAADAILRDGRHHLRPDDRGGPALSGYTGRRP